MHGRCETPRARGEHERSVARLVALAVSGAISGAIACTSPVAAQSDEPAETTAARTLFYAGVDASRAGDWALAEEKFEQAYALLPRAETLFNLAGARERVGKLVGAVHAYREFLRTATPELTERWAADVERALAALEGRIAHLTLRVQNLEPTDEVTLDDEVLDHAAMETPIAVDPGEHRVSIARGERIVAGGRATVTEGGEGEIELVLTHASEQSAAVLPIAPAEEPDGDTLWESPWTYTIGALVLAAIAGGIVASILLFDSSHFAGNIDPGSTGIR
jgi:tetratricopeptide (TPR) repeat protein